MGLIARRGHPYIPFDPADISHIEVTHRKWEFQQKGTVKNPDVILTAGRSYDAVIHVYDNACDVREDQCAGEETCLVRSSAHFIFLEEPLRFATEMRRVTLETKAFEESRDR